MPADEPRSGGGVKAEPASAALAGSAAADEKPSLAQLNPMKRQRHPGAAGDAKPGGSAERRDTSELRSVQVRVAYSLHAERVCCMRAAA